jgi:transposase
MTSFFGGSSEIWVPDNLKSGVHQPDRYEAVLNETYRDCASHYGACVIPARAIKPRDKAKVEVSVQVAQRWILARLRNRLFTSLEEANVAVAECLEILNNRQMRHLGQSRKELFETLDRPVLKPQPQAAFEFAVWKKATVNIDYHIAFDHHNYSTPYQLVKEVVEVRATAGVVEVFHRGQRVASHRRSHRRGKYTTVNEHMPESHRQHAEWTPERVIKWAGQIGTNTSNLVENILYSKKHPEQGFRSALGLIRLKDKYGSARVEHACGRALELSAYSYQFVNKMLQNKMDQAGGMRGTNYAPMDPEINKETNEVQLALLSAENIRGAGYYH